MDWVKDRKLNKRYRSCMLLPSLLPNPTSHHCLLYPAYPNLEASQISLIYLRSSIYGMVFFVSLVSFVSDFVSPLQLPPTDLNLFLISTRSSCIMSWIVLLIMIIKSASDFFQTSGVKTPTQKTTMALPALAKFG